VYDPAAVEIAVANVPRKQRKTLCDLSNALEISTTTLHRMLHNKDGPIKPVTTAMKPAIKDQNELALVAFCLDEVGKWFL
jgi:hypothetical protein